MTYPNPNTLTLTPTTYCMIGSTIQDGGGGTAQSLISSIIFGVGLILLQLELGHDIASGVSHAVSHSNLSYCILPRIAYL